MDTRNYVSPQTEELPIEAEPICASIHDMGEKNMFDDEG